MTGQIPAQAALINLVAEVAVCKMFSPSLQLYGPMQYKPQIHTPRSAGRPTGARAPRCCTSSAPTSGSREEDAAAPKAVRQANGTVFINEDVHVFFSAFTQECLQALIERTVLCHHLLCLVLAEKTIKNPVITATAIIIPSPKGTISRSTLSPGPPISRRNRSAVYNTIRDTSPSKSRGRIFNIPSDSFSAPISCAGH